MAYKARRALALLTVVLLLGVLDAPATGTIPSGEAGGSRGFQPLAGDPGWSDDLDDLSHVYVNATMPVGIEVSGGDAHLKAGKTDGWLASEVIECPYGYRYDLVLLEAETPGLSTIEISVLDATASPTNGDFANATIDGLQRKRATDVSLNSIDVAAYPSIRVQVDLHANGSDRPRLVAWAVHFVDEGEWRDDFLGTGKMAEKRLINLTIDGVEVDLSPDLGGRLGYYEPYPTISHGKALGGLRVVYANDGRTGYKPIESVGSFDTVSTGFGDFNKDGNMDLVAGSNHRTSWLLWGDEDGKYSTSRKIPLDVNGTQTIKSGDFNADGWLDIVFANGIWSGQQGSCIYLNDGNGSFSRQPDIELVGQGSYLCDVGDVNNDGYDDFAITHMGDFQCFYGGPSGPDTVADIHLPAGLSGQGGSLGDLDQDGYLDIIVYWRTSTARTEIYMGGPTGPDLVPDYLLPKPPGVTGGARHMGVGDINGDGISELITSYEMADTYDRLVIYKGTESGWNYSDSHEIDIGYKPYATIADIDRDGYDDIVSHEVDRNIKACVDIYKGGPTWPTGVDIKLVDTFPPGREPAVAIPWLPVGERAFKGSFVTEAINLPEGMRWDILQLEGTVPENTAVEVSVLDGSGETLVGDLTDFNVDLSGINPDAHRTIKVRVTIATDLNDTTPVLESLLVNWVDESTWREQFYGPAKVARTFGLDVMGGQLTGDAIDGTGPQVIITSLRNDLTYTSMSVAHLDSGGIDYITNPPMTFQTTGAMAASVADVNRDGFMDVAFACYASDSFDYETKSMVFLGSPVGCRDLPDWTFNTTGARDVLLEDLNGDGLVDIVFAQEKDGTTYDVDSLLFWGSYNGWDDEPDVRFDTHGASGVTAADLNGDGHMDLAFACYSDGTSRATDSMVFIQDEGSFDGASPNYMLATKGARAVASGDLNDDDRMDLVFANCRAGSSYETDSYVYLGSQLGGFGSTPIRLPTKGAQDVKVDDLDGEGHLDIVFADYVDDSGDFSAGSLVFLNDGTGGFGESPSHTMDTMGAMAVEVADLDGTGWKDLVFACHSNGSSYDQTSVSYLGGTSGWPPAPDIMIPTTGASDVVAAHLFDPGDCGYMSQTITPLDVEGTGSFHTFRYTARLRGDVTGTFHVYDALSWERLASLSIEDGDHEWDLRGEFYYKDHNRIRVVAEVEGMDASDTFELDDLFLNWTPRVKAPPRVIDLSLSTESQYRMNPVTLWLNVTDEYDPPDDMDLVVEHRLDGEIGWSQGLVGRMEFIDGVWTAEIVLTAETEVGTYHFKARATDKDGMVSEFFEPPVTLEVMNNIPTAPEISLGPESPFTKDTLTVTITRSAQDVENTGMTYRFYWSRNGILEDTLSTDHVLPEFTYRDQNWSVEVRAFDGDDEGPAAKAWVIIGNSAPYVKAHLPDMTFEEDGEAQTVELSTAFGDPDRDFLVFGVDPPNNLTVEVVEGTGHVTIAPVADWFGEEEVVFWASDGDLVVRQRMVVNVTPVNDPPRFVEINGKPVASGIMVLTVQHGNTLVITYSYNDVEGDLVMLAVDSDEVTLDDFLREIRFTPDEDMVGTVTFTLTLWDLDSPGDKQTLEFQIVVENVNDPPGVPTITAPPDGSQFEVNETFGLAGRCDDPDIKFGQVLTFTWTSNVSGTLGIGTALDVSLADAGAHLVTLTVSDGEFETSATLTIIIVPKESIAPPPPPPPSGEEEGFALWIPIVVVLALLGVTLAVASFTEPGKYRWGLMLAPLIIKKDEVLDNKTRYALHGIITEKPGIHYSAIKEEIGLSNGEAAYHLDVLEREEFIRSVRDGRLKRFYSYGTKVPKNPKMTPEETREAIVSLVRERPGISQQRIINELGIERPSAGYFLRELVKEGELKAEKQGLYTVYRVK